MLGPGYDILRLGQGSRESFLLMEYLVCNESIGFCLIKLFKICLGFIFCFVGLKIYNFDKIPFENCELIAHKLYLHPKIQQHQKINFKAAFNLKFCE